MHQSPETRVETDGIAIRSLRYARGLGRYELGKRAGVHGSYIGRIERGERRGQPGILLKIAEALGVTVADITRTVEKSKAA
jgi:XRE family transcriptional regulator, regulator of sulfur utilization